VAKHIYGSLNQPDSLHGSPYGQHLQRFDRAFHAAFALTNTEYD
jgi:hypothetical protein